MCAPCKPDANGDRHGSWQSVAKLQAHFGLDKKPDVNKASFRAAFAAAAQKGLDPRDFEYRFRSSATKIKGTPDPPSPGDSGMPGRPAGAVGTFLRLITINDSYLLDNYPHVASAVAVATAQVPTLNHSARPQSPAPCLTAF